MLSSLVKRAHIQPNPQAFKPGYIFGKHLVLLRAKEKTAYHLAKGERDCKKRGARIWSIRDTPLARYALEPGTTLRPPRIDFEKYLLGKVRVASRRKCPLRVLDIGGARFCQWEEFLFKHRGKVEFSGTNLSWSFDVPKQMRHMVKICSADRLHNFYPPGHFDVVVSHYGVAQQLLEAVENAIFLLKKGGQAIFSGECERREDFNLALSAKNAPYRTRARESDEITWFLWLEKTV